MNSIFKILQSLLLILTLVLLGLYFFQRKFIYYPKSSKPQLNPDLSKYYRDIQIQTQDGLSLTHWITVNSKSSSLPWIVLFHGNAGDLESIGYKYKFLAEEGHRMLLAGYRGYSGNPGSPSELHITQDSLLILKWLMEQENIPSSEIILYGESLGSCVAVAAAAEQPFRKIILEGAPSSVLEVGQKHAFPFLPVRWLLKDTWDSKSKIQRVQSDLFFIHGKKDQTVPFRFGLDLYQSAPSPKKHLWLENKGHNNLLDDLEARKKLLQFLSSS